jgi:hypothetical protein
MSDSTDTDSRITIPGMTSEHLDSGQGRLRYLTGGTGAPWSCCTRFALRLSTSATSSPCR